MEIFYGISLLVSHYKDKDAIINVLTKDCLLTLNFRGGYNYKNKKIIFTKPYIIGNFEVYKGKVGGYKFKDCEVLEYNDSINESFNKLICADTLSEVILKTIDGIDLDEKFLNNTIDIFRKINTEKNEYLNLSNYLIYVIDKLGIYPTLDKLKDELSLNNNQNNDTDSINYELVKLIKNKKLEVPKVNVNQIFKQISFNLIKFIVSQFQINLNCLKMY
ncbi:MAG: hypothetical protein IAC58_06360 [Firmicutes bacterium]|uniref:DNA repair protein RecO n=1 Tax=Candidatus Onthovivens merdipullorum TaxID=2840889 RepID=A0A9D9DK22_9BACL|nr:hypothetical protein [Candidatus Onthovivens merdipullorum]